MRTILKTKKAQMKIQQMSFMILGVFLFFVLVGMIVLTVKFTGIKQSATDLKEQNAILLVAKLASSPEFSCGEAFGNQKTDCVDLDKIMALKGEALKYTNFWGVSNIEIRRLYPATTPYREIKCTNSNYPNCNYINLFDKPALGYAKANFVALCRKEKYNDEVVNKCEMGQLIVRYEEVK